MQELNRSAIVRDHLLQLRQDAVEDHTQIQGLIEGQRGLQEPLKRPTAGALFLAYRDAFQGQRSKLSIRLGLPDSLGGKVIFLRMSHEQQSERGLFGQNTHRQSRLNFIRRSQLIHQFRRSAQIINHHVGLICHVPQGF